MTAAGRLAHAHSAAGGESVARLGPDSTLQTYILLLAGSYFSPAVRSFDPFTAECGVAECEQLELTGAYS
jgi:hypothetical protein